MGGETGSASNDGEESEEPPIDADTACAVCSDG
eukprot:COSAG04_NODE_22407_length_355_cov_0.992188_2_plen_32_part_01